MKYPIVQVKTQDGLLLYGLCLHAPGSDTVLINIHGTAGNFYEEYFIEVLVGKLLKVGVSILSVNNRGAGVYDPYQKTGAAVEKFEDCLVDIDTWIEFALEKGYRNILLSGHSLGTEKVVYYMSRDKHFGEVSSVILFAPADSYGSHRVLDGKPNPRTADIEKLLEESERLIEHGQGDVFLPRDSYGSREGIMPKSAESFLNFLGPNSKLLDSLPLNTRKLDAYSKIKVPILVIIGDREEYTALPTTEALDLMRRENENTQAFQIKDCDHYFQGRGEELAGIVLKFLNR
jgi:alpha-beta hydrolase superfamily lysophospholipase